jgi:hypothetical protein
LDNISTSLAYGTISSVCLTSVLLVTLLRARPAGAASHPPELIFSLGVLAVAVELTVPGILTPVTGALLHELSSIPVIMNSARLIGVKEQD